MNQITHRKLKADHFDKLYFSDRNVFSYFSFVIFKKQPPEVLIKKRVLKNSAKFTEKSLYHNLFFTEVTGLRTAGVFL